MDVIKNIVGIILCGLAIGLGLLLLTGTTQLVIFGPAAAWLVILIGVFSASSTNYPGMRMLGFGIIALGFVMWLRSADIIGIPFIRWAVGILLITLGIMSIGMQLRKPQLP